MRQSIGRSAAIPHPESSAVIVPINVDETLHLVSSDVAKESQHVAFLLGETTQSIVEFYCEAQRKVVEVYSDVTHATQNFVREVRVGAQRTKDAHPLALLAAIAGTAFAAGMLTRIWRSRDHA